MRRQLRGGNSPFKVRPRPNSFFQVGPAESIERLGEPAVFLRNLPAPAGAPGRLALPEDAPSDPRGYHYTFQRTKRIIGESIQPNKNARRGDRYLTNHAPIAAVRSLRTADRVLPVHGIERGAIVSEPVEWWRRLWVDYDVWMHETRSVEVVLGDEGRVLELADHPDLISDDNNYLRQVCVRIHSVRQITAADQRPEVETYAHDYTRIYFSRPFPAGTRFAVTLDLYDTIPVAYRTMHRHAADFGPLEFEIGDLEIVADPYYLISEGDLLIFAEAFEVAKEIAERDARTGLYTLRRGPVHGIDQVLDPAGRDITQLARRSGFRRFRIEDESPERVSVAYTFHPQYRVRGEIDYGALAGQQQPRIYHAAPDDSRVVLE